MPSFLRRLLGLSKGSEIEVHPTVAIMLGPQVPVGSLQDASELLASAIPEDRRRGAYALGGLGDRSVSPLLINAIRDVDELVCVYAIQSLGHLREHAAVLPLCELLAQNDVPQLVTTDAIAALAELRNSKAVGVLVRLLKSQDDFVRYDAAHALGEIGDSSAIPFLDAILSDATIPEREDQETLWSVGENARLAIEKIRSQT